MAKKPVRKKTRKVTPKRAARVRSSRRASEAAVGPDRWVKCVLHEGNIRGVAIHATGLVQSLSERHKLGPKATIALGESAIGALLIASYCKQKERVNLNILGSGLISQAFVDAYADGTVRGYVMERKPKHVHVVEDQGPWGTGLLSVLRTKASGEQPYTGTVPLLTGHLAKDLTFYWFQSEQIPSAVGLGVYMNGSKVRAAGGFLVQALPGADDEDVKLVQKHIQNLPSLKDTIVKQPDPVMLLSDLFTDMAFTLVEEKPVRFNCTCSLERVERSLSLIGTEELGKILQEDGHAMVKCDFCAKEYKVEKPRIQRLFEQSKGAR